jgi:hypothetical protein
MKIKDLISKLFQEKHYFWMGGGGGGADGRPGRAFVDGYIASPGYVPSCMECSKNHLEQMKTYREYVIVVPEHDCTLIDYRNLGVSRN